MFRINPTLSKLADLQEDEAEAAECLAGMVRQFVKTNAHWSSNPLCNDLLNVLTDAASDCEGEAQRHREKML